jgi:hypothetical protein
LKHRGTEETEGRKKEEILGCEAASGIVLNCKDFEGVAAPDGFSLVSQPPIFSSAFPLFLCVSKVLMAAAKFVSS